MTLIRFMDPSIEICNKCDQEKENTSEIGMFQDGLESILVLCDDCLFSHHNHKLIILV